MFTLASGNVLLLVIGIVVVFVSTVICIDVIRDIIKRGLTESNLGVLVCFSIMFVLGLISALIGSGILIII